MITIPVVSLLVFPPVSLKIHQESLPLYAEARNLLRGKNGKLFISHVLRSEASLSSALFGRKRTYVRLSLDELLRFLFSLFGLNISWPIDRIKSIDDRLSII